jgi:hypothetical protein
MTHPDLFVAALTDPGALLAIWKSGWVVFGFRPA